MFFFNDTATTEIYTYGHTLSLHDALPISGIGLDQLEPFGIAAGKSQIAQRLLVDRKDTAGRPVFRRHVGDGGAVRQRQIGEAGAEELDEAADDAALAEHLRHREHEVGRRSEEHTSELQSLLRTSYAVF